MVSDQQLADIYAWLAASSKTAFLNRSTLDPNVKPTRTLGGYWFGGGTETALRSYNDLAF
jgi:hypothetical protein